MFVFRKILNALPVTISNQKSAKYFIQTEISSVRNQLTSSKIKRFTVTTSDEQLLAVVILNILISEDVGWFQTDETSV